jgi:hypothetical protein
MALSFAGEVSKNRQNTANRILFLNSPKLVIADDEEDFFNHGWTRMNTDKKRTRTAHTKIGAAMSYRERVIRPSLSVRIRVHPWF